MTKGNNKIKIKLSAAVEKLRTTETNQPAGVKYGIVCEGELAEIDYFNGFKYDLTGRCIIKSVGIGSDTLAIVEKAVELKNRALSNTIGSKTARISIWAVFDRDEFQEKRWQAAFALAEANGIHIAYSNPCFELWFLHHFQELSHNTHISPKQIGVQIADKLNEHNVYKPELNHDCGWKGMYYQIKDKTPIAIERSEKIHKLHKIQTKKGEKIQDKNPCTTLHLLVKELYSYLIM